MLDLRQLIRSANSLGQFSSRSAKVQAPKCPGPVQKGGVLSTLYWSNTVGFMAAYLEIDCARMDKLFTCIRSHTFWGTLGGGEEKLNMKDTRDQNLCGALRGKCNGDTIYVALV